MIDPLSMTEITFFILFVMGLRKEDNKTARGISLGLPSA
jgi:hypothetical protein